MEQQGLVIIKDIDNKIVYDYILVKESDMQKAYKVIHEYNESVYGKTEHEANDWSYEGIFEYLTNHNIAYQRVLQTLTCQV